MQITNPTQTAPEDLENNTREAHLTSISDTHPPKPRLTVRVGVTGHRKEGLPPPGKDQPLHTAVRKVLEEIKKITIEIYSQRNESGVETYSSEEPCLRLISPLAEGADRLVAEESLKLDFELHCPLPFDREEYSKDFDSGSSRENFLKLLDRTASILELDGPMAIERRPEAYEMVGRTVLRHSDVLVAIWDQERPFGIDGTGQIVQEALSLGIPVIWIDPHLAHAPALWELAKQEYPGVRKDLSLLRKRLKNIFQFPKGEQASFSQFLEERQPAWNHGFLFKLFCKAWVWNWSSPRLKINDYLSFARAQWEETWRNLSLAEQYDVTEKKATNPLETSYIAPFAWADGLAEFYANKYRSSFVAAYLLGAFSILFAYLGGRTIPNHIYFSIIELSLIGTIVFSTVWGRRRFWHQRWMDYRALAEELRQMQFLSLLGRATSSLNVPPHLKPGDPINKWFSWYFRAFSRQTGLIQARLNDSYLESYRQVLENAIQSQLAYHKENAEKYDKLSRHIRLSSHILFFAALVFCFIHIVTEAPNLTPLLVFGTIVFPAFGGALGAIAHSGEFERIALRSGAIRNRLETLAWQLRGMDNETSRELGNLAQKVSEIALEELVDWRAAVVIKDLDLPA